MHEELIRNLRNESKYALPSQTRKALIEAADIIAKLSAENKRLDEALKKAFLIINSLIPNLVRCEDCQFLKPDVNENYLCRKWRSETDLDGFCYLGRRREDGNGE